MTDEQTVASRRIADDFATQIEAGELVPGAKLPSERTLVTTYGVARNTVQAAMRLLADAGMVVPQHGRGVYVRHPAPLIRLGSDRYSQVPRKRPVTVPDRVRARRQEGPLRGAVHRARTAPARRRRAAADR